ncbi:hypothetical protein F4820DRAFT_177407 [Hypoxylon rubiginosum]|uniref:Uncharacterized protein n=1 Tax=Hypoxylon rubiginosum TaxID=110542 RepID=A0ACB9YII6_9PEZI|nr:hypothetical protein F4820DRAFT_177407 [Hypoxylon rubiginosum]
MGNEEQPWLFKGPEIKRPESPSSMFESTSTSSSGMATPTDTMTSDNSIDDLQSMTSQNDGRIDTPPYPGRTFAIRERESGRLITLIDGDIRLEYCTGEQGGWHWRCAEDKGWLTFRSPVSGQYIGGNAIRQRFCAREHSQGGYELLSRRDDELVKIHIGKDNRSLIRRAGGETLWDFEEVVSARLSTL